jgi:hypothetical protein
MRFALQCLGDAAERVVAKYPNILQDMGPAISGIASGRLFCGVAVAAYAPGHTLVGPR